MTVAVIGSQPHRLWEYYKRIRSYSDALAIFNTLGKFRSGQYKGQAALLTYYGPRGARNPRYRMEKLEDESLRVVFHEAKYGYVRWHPDNSVSFGAEREIGWSRLFVNVFVPKPWSLFRYRISGVRQFVLRRDPQERGDTEKPWVCGLRDDKLQGRLVWVDGGHKPEDPAPFRGQRVVRNTDWKESPKMPDGVKALVHGWDLYVTRARNNLFEIVGTTPDKPFNYSPVAWCSPQELAGQGQPLEAVAAALYHPWLRSEDFPVEYRKVGVAMYAGPLPVEQIRKALFTRLRRKYAVRESFVVPPYFVGDR